MNRRVVSLLLRGCCLLALLVMGLASGCRTGAVYTQELDDSCNPWQNEAIKAAQSDLVYGCLIVSGSKNENKRATLAVLRKGDGTLGIWNGSDFSGTSLPFPDSGSNDPTRFQFVALMSRVLEDEKLSHGVSPYDPQYRAAWGKLHDGVCQDLSVDSYQNCLSPQSDGTFDGCWFVLEFQPDVDTYKVSLVDPPNASGGVRKVSGDTTVCALYVGENVEPDDPSEIPVGPEWGPEPSFVDGGPGVPELASCSPRSDACKIDVATSILAIPGPTGASSTALWEMYHMSSAVGGYISVCMHQPTVKNSFFCSILKRNATMGGYEHPTKYPIIIKRTHRVFGFVGPDGKLLAFLEIYDSSGKTYVKASFYKLSDFELSNAPQAAKSFSELFTLPLGARPALYGAFTRNGKSFAVGVKGEGSFVLLAAASGETLLRALADGESITPDNVAVPTKTGSMGTLTFFVSVMKPTNSTDGTLFGFISSDTSGAYYVNVRDTSKPKASTTVMSSVISLPQLGVPTSFGLHPSGKFAFVGTSKGVLLACRAGDEVCCGAALPVST
jgi:hypothetical protein